MAASSACTEASALPSAPAARVDTTPPSPTPPSPRAVSDPRPTREAWTRRLTLEHAAYRSAGPSAIVHAPVDFDPQAPLHLVVFLHGYSGCAWVLFESGETRCAAGVPAEPGWGLGAVHDEAGTNSLFVVLQLAWRRREGSPGALGREGQFASLLNELLAAVEPELGAARRAADVASVTLLAHSAAFETSIALLRRGGVEIRNLVLLDSLYSGVPVFLEWAADDGFQRTLVSFHTGGTTGRRAQELAGSARRRGIDLVYDPTEGVAAAAEHRIVVIPTRAPHRRVPERHIGETLLALGLPRR